MHRLTAAALAALLFLAACSSSAPVTDRRCYHVRESGQLVHYPGTVVGIAPDGARWFVRDGWRDNTPLSLSDSTLHRVCGALNNTPFSAIERSIANE